MPTGAKILPGILIIHLCEIYVEYDIRCTWNVSGGYAFSQEENGAVPQVKYYLIC